MTTLLLDATALQVENPVRLANGRNAMGDEEDRPPPLPVGSSRPVVETLQDAMLGRRVQRRRGFVEDQDLGILRDCAGDGQALTLAGRKLPAAVAELGIEPVRLARHVVVHAGYVGGLPDLIVGSIGGRVAEVVAHAHGEQHILLERDGDVSPQALDLDAS